MWQFPIVTGDLRAIRPAKHQVTLPLTDVNKVDARGPSQSVPNLSEERTFRNYWEPPPRRSHNCPEYSIHTAGSDTIFVQIYMDALPGVPGVSKNSQKYATNKSVEFLR